MGDEERKSLEAKIDIILMQLAEIKQDRKDCRSHCDSTTGVVFGKIETLAEIVNKMLGAKHNPYWYYVGGMIVFGLINVFLIIHFGKAAH